MIIWFQWRLDGMAARGLPAMQIIRPRVLATCAMPQAVEGTFRSFADLSVLGEGYDSSELLEKCKGKDALVCTLTDLISAAFIDRLPAEVKIIATYSVGLDHIDVSAVKKRGIVLVNTPDVLTHATADIAILLLLGAARRAWEAQTMLRQKRWQGWEPTQLLGADLQNKVLGILGFGRIGRAVAERARGFGMKVRTFVRNLERAHTLPKYVEQCESMEEVLANSDFVSLHLPLTPDTTAWLDSKRLMLMKPGGILINTARGGLIDERALVDSLHSGRLGGVGLDVFANEPRVSNELLAAPNTYLLPHIGSATTGAREAMGLSLASDVAAFFAGRAITCQVETA